MSAYRSPGGRHRRPGPGRPTGTAVAPPPVARHRAAARNRSLARNGMASATVGALAVALPAMPFAADKTPVATVALRPASVVSDGGQPRMLAGLALVETAPEPAQLQVADVVKAAELTEAALAEQRAWQAREEAVDCEVDLDGLGAVKPWVRAGAEFLSCHYDRPAMIGVAGRAGHSDHPSGHALDVLSDREHGDRIADCALANRTELGVSYVIWRQRVEQGDGWEPMADRGSPTANHFDHVHISFEHTEPDGVPDPTRCR